MGLEESIEIDIDEEDLESIVEKLTVDIKPQKSGWAGTASQEHYEWSEKELLALEQDTKSKKSLQQEKAVRSTTRKKTIKAEEHRTTTNQ